eukprot:XP_001705336.1 Hypothetical protein GL50803_38957 [Giardia lamblia ATCC 50803]
MIAKLLEAPLKFINLSIEPKYFCFIAGNGILKKIYFSLLKLDRVQERRLLCDVSCFLVAYIPQLCIKILRIKYFCGNMTCKFLHSCRGCPVHK